MKLCWDNIEDLRYSKKVGKWYNKSNTAYLYRESCQYCKESFLGTTNAVFCSTSCRNKHVGCSKETRKKLSESAASRYQGKNNPMYGKKHTEESKKKMSEMKKAHMTDETRRKLSEARKGTKLSDETKKKISQSLLRKHDILSKNNRKESNPNWKGGYREKGIPTYDLYAPRIEWCEEVRRNKEDPNVLEVKCFKCNNWYVPTISNTKNRIQFLKGSNMREQRFYCSEECKQSCSIFGKSINTIMKEDAVRAGRLPWLELRREVQPELRQMVLERDEHKCVKCNDSNNLECHHILPVNIEPLLSADINNCITLCEKCHKEVHKEIDGCNYNQLHIEEC